MKPEFFDDEDLCVLPFEHRLCYIGLWTQADKAGRMEDRPKRLKARIFPYDAVDMDALLTDLTRAGFIVRYLVDGKQYLAIKEASWKKHQRPRIDEPESVLPAITSAEVVVSSLCSDEPDTAEMLGKERKGREREGEMEGSESAETLTRSTPAESDPDEPHDEVLLVFPVVGKGGPEWRLRRRQVTEWAGLYPTIDVEAECRMALGWVKSHPGRTKTVRGMPAFLTSWFNRATNRGGPSPSHTAVAGNGGDPGLAQRAEAFQAWYREAHGRYVGVPYVCNEGRDRPAALAVVKDLSDQEARDAATVWFGMDDPFATNGTRTIPKFASRASDCLLKARKALGVNG